MTVGTLTSRDRVLSVFAGELPDRVPCWCGAAPEFWDLARAQLALDDEALRQRFHDDFHAVRAPVRLAELPLSPGATCRTVFGVEHFGVGFGQALAHPLAGADAAAVADYPWPDPAAVEVSTLRAQAQAHQGRYAILGGDGAPFFHDALDLLGMETFLVAMYQQPELVDAVLARVVDFYVEVNRRIFDEAADVIDIFFIGNDFGAQNGPLMSPDCFGRFLLPHLARLVDLGHQYGLKVQLHSCGGLYPLLPLLVESGLDALQALQPTCRDMDLAVLKREFGGALVLNGGIDTHHVLIDGDVDTVRRETRRVLDLMMPGGRYIGGASHDAILPETPLENVLAMFDTIVEVGRYP